MYTNFMTKCTINVIQYNLLLFILISIFGISCSPLPMIQSARVTGKAGLGVSYAGQSHCIEVMQKDTSVISDSIYTRINDRSIVIEPRGFFRLGINDRVEVTACILPNIMPPSLIVNGNVKVMLFEIGSDRLFNNIALALFVGGDVIPSEWDTQTNTWGGLIVGTHCPIYNSDLELVCMMSGSYLSLLTTSDGNGEEDISFATANFSLGSIFRPTKHNFLEINIGITARIGFKKHYSADINNTSVIYSEAIKFTINPVVFQSALMLYIPRK